MNWLRHPRLIQCANTLMQGGVVAYPTEAVWGLGCDPFNAQAVGEILNLKHRSREKGLILVAANIQQLDFLLAPLAKPDYAKLQASWPGHTTWLVPHQNAIPSFIHGDFDSVAVRVSAHPLVSALCTLCNGPIVSTSANPQGLPPARNEEEARRYFGDSAVEFAPEAAASETAPSQIIDLRSGKIIR